eukprot:Lithocolla_globosa_v1_NODE_336_length_4409_cov_89.919844.p3 type:complete len:129 gc:universal NODE_336_length_4409_cov_89.919844:3280-2894(-)
MPSISGIFSRTTLGAIGLGLTFIILHLNKGSTLFSPKMVRKSSWKSGPTATRSLSMYSNVRVATKRLTTTFHNMSESWLDLAAQPYGLAWLGNQPNGQISSLSSGLRKKRVGSNLSAFSKTLGSRKQL